MSLATRLLALLLFAIPLGASAGEVTARWGDLEIPFDPAVWRHQAPREGLDGVVLTCIAADCPADGQVFAFIAPSDGGAEEPPWRAPKPIALGASALPFLAYELWSGCRAMDVPILSAAVVFRDRLYRLISPLGAGCNFGEQLPLERFADLVRSIRPREFNTIAVGGIRITYDAHRWATGKKAEGQPTEGVSIACTHRDCGQWNDQQPKVRVSVVPDDGVQCVTDDDLTQGFARDGGTQTFGGLTLRLWTTFSGCRALAPAELNACGRHNGSLYRFVSGVHVGCSGIWNVPEPMFLELLSGITVADDMPAAP